MLTWLAAMVLMLERWWDRKRQPREARIIMAEGRLVIAVGQATILDLEIDETPYPNSALAFKGRLKYIEGLVALPRAERAQKVEDLIVWAGR